MYWLQEQISSKQFQATCWRCDVVKDEDDHTALYTNTTSEKNLISGSMGKYKH